MTEISMPGGMGNAGLVVRVGDTVRRPWRASTPATHQLLAHLDRVLPGVAPVPLGRDEQGREVLTYLDGDVAVPPYPEWAVAEPFLDSLGRLLRRIHDALEGWQPPPDVTWSDQIPDPHGGPVVTHADICPENVVARHGEAVAVVDWEFAAPGRRIWDVVSTARLCVPFTAPQRRDRAYDGTDVVRRLHLFLDAYGLGPADRRRFTDVLDERRRAGERFVLRRVALGEPLFVRAWGGQDGRRRLDLERDWVAALPRDVAADGASEAVPPGPPGQPSARPPKGARRPE